MNLPKNFYAPFDITYRVVSEKILRHCDSVKDPDTVEWLKTLVISFWDERLKWPNNPLAATVLPYGEYMMAASRLQSQILQLTACAYLHISYDLPRVLADEWPANGNWISGPDEFTGENAYFALRGIFPEVMNELRGRREVVGVPGYILRLAPEEAVRALAEVGMGNLRCAAWLHARRLYAAGHSGRRRIEPKMMEAMTAALLDVQYLKPWRIGLLSPPHSAVLNSYVIAAASLSWLSTSLFVTAAMAATGFGAFFLWQRRQLRSELVEFIEELGRRVMDYVDVATRDPEALDGYLRQRTTRPVNESRTAREE